MFWLPVDRTSDLSLIRQVYLSIRQRIHSGELSPGQRLPASRSLAAELDVSRTVVLEAYEQLTAEGYLVGRKGSGTYVAQSLLWEEVPATVTHANPLRPEFDGIDFRSGVPALDSFPRQLWARLTKQVCMEAANHVFGYGLPAGSEELRSALATYLRRTRGVNCSPAQIVITSGAAQGFLLLAQLLLQPGDRAILEDPIAPEIGQRFSSVGGAIVPVPVDELGLRTHLLPREEKPKLVLVTPSHQFPLGGVLPIQRRIELLQFAREMDCWIVEDDYDSEFRFQGGPISSLQGLDPERVFYIGTFSKILSPAFRIGYLVLPSDWVEPCCDRKGLDDLHTTWIEQLVLAKFIELGHLERHIARMKKCYRQRRDVLKQCLKAAFSERVTVQGDSTGLHLVAEFRDVEFSEAVLRSLEAGGVKIYPVEHYAIVKGKHLHRIVLGYGNLTPEAIALGVNRLAAILGCSNSFEKE